MDGRPDGSTDKSDDVQKERNFPRSWSFGKFHTGLLISIFIMNFADGWMDRIDGGHTDRHTELQVESCLG